MIPFTGLLRFSKIYSSDWSMDDKRNPGQKVSGTSYKAQVIDEDSATQPTFDISKDCFESLGLSDEKKSSLYVKVPVTVEIEIINKSFEGRSYPKILINSIKLQK